MARTSETNLRCFLAIPFAPEYEAVRQAVERGVHKSHFEAVSPDKQPSRTIQELVLAEVARADCIVADVSTGNPNVFFEVGLGAAMGKGIIPLTRRDSHATSPYDLSARWTIGYDATPAGMMALAEAVASALQQFRRSPRRGQFFLPGRASTPFYIDWDRLEPDDLDNLCRELLAQMGFRRIEWNKESREIDLVAELPKKDPDGFEYKELWLISLGRRAPIEMLLDMAYKDPEYLVHRVLRERNVPEERWMRSGEDVPVILLFIVPRELTSDEQQLDLFRERFKERGRRGRFAYNLRVRLWDRDYLARLLQLFPQIGYKYFSDEARSLAKFRKGPEDLYRENVNLTERLAAMNAELEEEKNRRLRAERDSIWRDISFAAAHKIGNPIFAIETDLDPLRKRILEHRTPEANEVIDNMQAAVEKAKAIVEQFKSLTKAQQIAPVRTPLRPILDDAGQVLRERGVQYSVVCDPSLVVFGDPDRLAEVFDELVANSLHWLDKTEREIRIEATVPVSTALPQIVDTTRRYALIHFRDTGSGVPIELKERIFQAFFTTYDQGTGLGLALVRRIVEGHGGAIRESGAPGSGADFEIYLPLANGN